MAYYHSITIEEMDDELRAARFYPVSLLYRNKPVKEWVYERKLPRSPNHFVRVYTGINRYGRDAGNSRKVGKDAIRVQVIYRDIKGETLVSQPKRVHRVEGWRKNLRERFNELSKNLPQVEFDSRGEPMTLRKKNKSYFWGSRDYPKYKETKPFRAEEFALEEEFCDEHFQVTETDLYNSITRIINNKSPTAGQVFRHRNDITNELWPRPRTNAPVWNNPLDENLPPTRRTYPLVMNIYQHYVDRFCQEYEGESPLIKEELLDNITERLSRPLYFVLDIDWLFLNEYDYEGEAQENSAIRRYAQLLVITNGFSLEWVLQNAMPFELSAIFDEEPDDYGRSYKLDDYGTLNWIYLGEGREAAIPEIQSSESDTYGVYPRDFYERILPYTDDNYFNRQQDSPMVKWQTLFQSGGRERIPRLLGNQYDATFLPFQFLITELIGCADMVTEDEDYELIEEGEMEMSREVGYTFDSAFEQTFFNAEDEPDWEDIEWETDKPPAKKGPEDWGDDVEWDAEEDWVSIGDQAYLDDYFQKPNKWGFRCTACGNILASVSECKKGYGTVASEARALGPIDEVGFCFSCGGWCNAHDQRMIPSYYTGPFSDVETAIDAWQQEQLNRSHGAKLGHEVSRLVEDDKVKRAKLGLKPIHETNWDEDFDEEGHRTDTWRKRYRKERKEHREEMRNQALRNRRDEEKEAEEGDEITLKEFDDTGIGYQQKFKTIDDQITFQLRKHNKINRYGDIGCPVCNSIGLFGSEIIAKGRKWFCWDCGYEEKEETIKSRGDITLEKYGLLIECPVCEKAVKAYNQDSMNRHIKKCRDKNDMATKKD